MTTCTHRLLNEPTGLRCIRPAHDDRGHVYHSGSGSDVDDHKAEGGHG